MKLIKISLLTFLTIILVIAIIFGITVGYWYKYPTVYSEGSANFTVTAHTGCEGSKANSIDSLKAGLDSGADVLEVDVRFLENGTPVLAHDEEEVNESCVYLREAFEYVKTNDVKFNLDMKEVGKLEYLAALVTEFGYFERVFFTGIEEKDIPKVKEKAPDIDFYLNTEIERRYDKKYLESLGQKAASLGAVGINCSYTRLTKRAVDIWREKGLAISVYTVDNKIFIHKAIYCGVDNITSKQPKKVIAEINALA